MPTGRSFPHPVLWLFIWWLHSVAGQCPWHREVPELHSSCICAYNLGQELSVQCDQVDFPKLLHALDLYAATSVIDLLYVNNSTLPELLEGSFRKVTLHNVQLSGCHIRNIQPGAFRGQERSLKNLNLQENELKEVPVDALRNLFALNLLDLSKNKITKISDESFTGLNIATLKLSDNNLSLSQGAFRGLETSLKNLNLKGTKQKKIPEAVRGLRALAFLDLAQNALRDLPENGLFEEMDSLTAVNLERNLIQNIGASAFFGINDTLSSLSLLNNLITEFPTAAISLLTELRVLDIGFNLITELPEDAFLGNPSLTLLALDGNPLSTVPNIALRHLNSTLRGLSLGGRFLHCDCRLRWVAEWIRRGDLQVTSRERNPQFCGSPPRFKDRGFYSIEPKELICGNDSNELTEIYENAETDTEDRKVLTFKPPTLSPDDKEFVPAGEIQEYRPPVTIMPSGTSNIPVALRPEPTKPVYTYSSSPPRKQTTPRQLLTNTTTQPTTTYKTTSSTKASTTSTTTQAPVTTTTTPLPTTISTTSLQTSTVATTMKITKRPQPKVTPSWRPTQRPPIVMAYPARNDPVGEDKEVLVRNAYRQDNSVIIQWDSETANILGFRVVYRLFGDKSFKQGPPLEASEREFKIKNVPSQECIVVCVISLEEVNVTPETVPYPQCREVRTVNSPASNMDKITIAASAAICGTVIIAVIIFVAASRRRSRKLQTLDHPTKTGIQVTGIPVQCCTGFGSTSPGGPLSSLAALNAFGHKEWDQVSVYSNRSIPRPQVYHMERQGSINARCTADDMRSHVSHASHFSSKPTKTRSIADGQSHHSFNNSTRYLGASGAFPGLVSSRPELRQSRQSLASVSRMSYPSTHAHAQPTRARSASRQHDTHRPGSRFSTAGSTHTLNNYCDNSDNWTDHDMDIYMTRNPTTRNGFVPL